MKMRLLGLYLLQCHSVSTNCSLSPYKLLFISKGIYTYIVSSRQLEVVNVMSKFGSSEKSIGCHEIRFSASERKSQNLRSGEDDEVRNV